MPDASASLEAGEAPRAEPAARPEPARPAAAPGAPSRRSSVDRILTIGLLGFGLVNVITGVPAYLDYATFADAFVRTAELDATFTNVAAGRLWGTVAAILFALVWFATAVLSYLQLRRGRTAFWIPLVGAVVAAVAVGVCLAVPLLGDPAIVHALVPTPAP